MWSVKFSPEAMKDMKKIDNSLRAQVLVGIRKVMKNPLPQSEGGFGKPLGNVGGTDLTGFFKIKYRGIGIRVVYTLVRKDEVMNIIVVSLREDGVSYQKAEKRKDKYGKKIFEDIFE